MADWIHVLFPKDDQEAFTEALERRILGEYGPESPKNALDDLVEHAKNHAAFRGSLREVIAIELARDWHDCVKNGSRDHQLIMGYLTLIRRTPIDCLDAELCDWFDRYALMLEDDMFLGRAIGNSALLAIHASNPEPDAVRTAWWMHLQGTEAWSGTVCELFP